MKTIVYDTRLNRQVGPLLDVDAIAVYRTTVATDSEGDPTGSRTRLDDGTWRGTVTDMSSQEELVAAERGSRVDKVLCTRLGKDIEGGDFVQVNGDVTYEAVDVNTRRLFMRVTLRIVK